MIDVDLHGRKYAPRTRSETEYLERALEWLGYTRVRGDEALEGDV